jgi:bifunctional DNA-binding transcriptional regulator/antitoxin component of YhaV-PrlF toxin-antitoxin module
MSSKRRVTIPDLIRERLGAQPADMISYEMEANEMQIKRVEPLDDAFHSALSMTLEEWTTKEDEKAFRNLV